MSQKPAYDIAFYVPTVTPLLAKTGEFPPGGAETQIFLLAQALSRLGCRVCLVAYRPVTGELPRSIGGVDIVIRPRYVAHQRLIGKVREALRVGQTLGGIKTSVVVTRMAGAHVGLVALAAKFRRRRFVYSSANISDFDFKITGAKARDVALFHLGVRMSDEVVVQTREQALLCEERFGRSAVVINSIAQVAVEPRREPEALLWIGRFVWYKRPLEFLELVRAMPDVPFRMVGVPATSDSALAKRVASVAATLPNVELLDARPRGELMDLVMRSAAIVNTADFEGMPNVFLEGWARGVPALSLTHDPDGVIETYGIGEYAAGSGQAFADAARRLWASRLESHELADRCKRYVGTHHSETAVAQQWISALGVVRPTGVHTLAEAT